ncbi:MAG: hypothetical protein AVDCRST_MAG11-1668, partial [uncultured Gemmatimonadaceae bacterium]
GASDGPAGGDGPHPRAGALAPRARGGHGDGAGARGTGRLARAAPPGARRGRRAGG